MAHDWNAGQRNFTFYRDPTSGSMIVLAQGDNIPIPAACLPIERTEFDRYVAELGDAGLQTRSMGDQGAQVGDYGVPAGKTFAQDLNTLGGSASTAQDTGPPGTGKSKKPTVNKQHR